MGDSERFVEQACALLDHAPTPLTTQELSSLLGVSSSHCVRQFKEVLGITPKQYSSHQRAQRLRERLDRGQDIVGSAFESGFESVSQVYEKSPHILGMTPRQRQQQTPPPLHVAIAQTSLGSMLIAQTEKGICDIVWGQNASELMKQFQEKFPTAVMHPQDQSFEHTVAQIVGLVEHSTQPSSLHLHIQGTAFEQKVWEALKNIPVGQTRTYAQVAQSIGMPKAVRAVANACAANRLALVVPCHRVVRSDGGLGGYRWGVENKEKILAHERLLFGSSPSNITASTSLRSA